MRLPAASTSSWPRAGSPAGTSGARSRRFRWCPLLWTRSHRPRDRRRRDRGCPRRGRRPGAGRAGGVVGHTVPAGPGDALHPDYRQRLLDAAETDAEWYADLYEVGWPDAPRRRSATRRRRHGRPRAGPHRGVAPAKVTSSRTFPPAKQSSGTSRERRWSVPRATSRRSPCGPDRVLRSPDSHRRPQRSWPSSSLACNRSRRGIGRHAVGERHGRVPLTPSLFRAVDSWAGRPRANCGSKAQPGWTPGLPAVHPLDRTLGVRDEL